VPENLNQGLYDRDVAHQVGVYRLSEGVSKSLVGLVDRASAQVVEAVRVSRVTSVRTQQRTQALVDVVKRVSDDLSADMLDDLRSQVSDLVEYELEFQERSSRTRGLAHPSVKQVSREIESAPVCGRLLAEWCADVSYVLFRRTRDVVRTGVEEGLPEEYLLSSVVGSRRLNYRDGVVESVRRDVGGLAQTLVTRSTVLAKASLFEANDDVFDREMWCSVVDGSTSSPCRARDGQVSKLGDGPRPPAHWRCRSTILGLLRGFPPPSRDTYSKWVARQTSETQDEVLGASQAKLFREGGLKLDRFVDRTGAAYTVAELRVRERAAFTRAGL
jgi:hypothetical protein